MLGIAFELADLARVFVDVRQQPARGFAIEARGRDERITMLFALRPRFGLDFCPIVPTLFGWKRGQMNPAGTLIKRFVAHARGTDCPACTYACSYMNSAISATRIAIHHTHGAKIATATPIIEGQNQRAYLPATMLCAAKRACAVA